MIAREGFSGRSNVFGTYAGGQTSAAQDAHPPLRRGARTSSRRWSLSLAGPRHRSGAGGPGSLVRAVRGRSSAGFARHVAGAALADELRTTYLRSAPSASAGTSRGVPAGLCHPNGAAREAGAKEENH